MVICLVAPAFLSHGHGLCLELRLLSIFRRTPKRFACIFFICEYDIEIINWFQLLEYPSKRKGW
uniref:Uncharacterized protein n=1 Tax=Arundo donax TaxID=35708 RepID=A0A0A9U735_ARUDO